MFNWQHFTPTITKLSMVSPHGLSRLLQGRIVEKQQDKIFYPVATVNPLTINLKELENIEEGFLT